MVAIKALTVLALAGATIAVPVANPEPLPVGEALERREPQWSGSGRPAYRWSWRWGGQGAREGQSQDQSTPTADATPAASSSPPAVATSAPSTDDSSNYSPPQGQYQGGSNSGSESSTPATPATPAAQPSSGSSSGSTGSSSGSGYIGIVNEWRQKMGLSDLEESSMLQGNADKAATNANGQLVHQLNPGTMGQVMAPGNAGNFESVFVGGWLCEIPTLPGLGASVCDSASQGWDHAGQTGHAKILTSPDYSKIGCALETGIWSCDLA